MEVRIRRVGMNSRLCVLVLIGGLVGCSETARPPASDADRFELRTDGEGRTLRIDRKTGETFVLKGTQFVPVQVAQGGTASASRSLAGSDRSPKISGTPTAEPSQSLPAEPPPQIGSIVNLKGSAPIYLLPEAHRIPLIVAADGSSVKLLSAQPGWFEVQFKDSRFESRIGYVESKFVASTVQSAQAAAGADSAVSHSSVTAAGSPSTFQSPSAPVATSVAPSHNPGAASQASTQSARSTTKQRVPVTIIGRQDFSTQYTFTVPGSWHSTGTASANCFGTSSGNAYGTSYGNSASARYTGTSSTNCLGTSQTSGTITPPREYSYQVSGATLSLQLGDGRVVVANCDRKFAVGGWRSCRIPMIKEVFVEFSGSNAKIFWSVSIDGSKLEDETYKILAVLTK